MGGKQVEERDMALVIVQRACSDLMDEVLLETSQKHYGAGALGQFTCPYAFHAQTIGPSHFEKRPYFGGGAACRGPGNRYRFSMDGVSERKHGVCRRAFGKWRSGHAVSCNVSWKLLSPAGPGDKAEQPHFLPAAVNFL
jgi:hypothetical protein